MKKIIPVLLLAFLTFDAQAGQTPWVEVAPGAKLRMIFSDVKTNDDYTMIAIELEMPAGTNSYWRVPGETGVPLQIDLSSSQDVSIEQISWPFPERKYAYGYVDHVYYGNLVLPILLHVDQQNPFFQAEIVLGVCSDVCVPVSVNIEHQMSFEKRDARAALQIAQTMANTPIAWDQPLSPFGSASFFEADQLLSVPVNDKSLETESMIATIGDSYIVFGPPQMSADGTFITFEKLGGNDISQMDDQQVTLTFMTQYGPYEIIQPLAMNL